MRPHHLASRGAMNEILDKLRLLIVIRFPTLHLIEDRYLRGSYPVEEAGNELDRFSIEVDFDPLNQEQMPKVRETGGRIPWREDCHVNKDGTACVCLPEDYFFKYPGRFDPLIFLEGPVRDYFIGQALVARGDPWPHGEWQHGNVGRTDWFTEFIEGLSPIQMKAYLEILSLKELKGHITCPCGSLQRIRNCHLPFLKLLRIAISSSTARKILSRKH